MEIPATNNEGEPATSKKLFRFISLFTFFVILILASCNEMKKEIKEVKPAVVSTAVKQQKLFADSLLKAKMTIRKKMIYLTFDDGPNKGTMNVFNAIKADSVPASFFIVGKHVFDSPAQAATFKQLQSDSAIELCNHSYTHALNHYTKFYEHPEEVVKDIELNKEKLKFNNNIVRMPGRNSWRIDTIVHTDIKESKLAIDSVGNAGFAVMGWDVEWMFDHKSLTLTTETDQLLRQIQNMLESEKTKTPGHLVLLAHDQSFQSEASVQQLHYLLRQLKDNPEYELVLAGNYPGIKNKFRRSSEVNQMPSSKR